MRRKFSYYRIHAQKLLPNITNYIKRNNDDGDTRNDKQISNDIVELEQDDAKETVKEIVKIARKSSSLCIHTQLLPNIPKRNNNKTCSKMFGMECLPCFWENRNKAPLPWMARGRPSDSPLTYIETRSNTSVHYFVTGINWVNLLDNNRDFEEIVKMLM